MTHRPSFIAAPPPPESGVSSVQTMPCCRKPTRGRPRLGPLPADNDQIASRSCSRGDGEGVRADDREAIALIEPARAVILVPDVEKDVRRFLEARVIEDGVQQLSSDA